MHVRVILRLVEMIHAGEDHLLDWLIYCEGQPLGNVKPRIICSVFMFKVKAVVVKSNCHVQIQCVSCDCGQELWPVCKHHILISFYINLEIIGNIFNVFSSFNLHFLDIWLARVTGQQNRSSIIRQSNSKRKLGVLCHTHYIGTWFLISGWMKTDNVAIPAFSWCVAMTLLWGFWPRRLACAMRACVRHA